MSKSSKSGKNRIPPKPKQPGDPGCIFHGLKEADRKTVLRQHADHWAERGGLPRRAHRENVTVCRNLTYDEAVHYLSLINRRLLSHRGVMSALVVPFVVGWWIDGPDGDSLGFPVEVWMSQAEDDQSAAAGLYDIVDRSAPLFRLPWLWGMGWVWDEPRR